MVKYERNTFITLFLITLIPGRKPLVNLWIAYPSKQKEIRKTSKLFAYRPMKIVSSWS